MTSLLLSPVKDFGRRLRLIGLVPVGALVAFVLALLAAGAPGQAPNVGRLAARLGELTLTQGVCVVLGVVVLVLLLQPAQLALLRLLEGYYWDRVPLLAALARKGRGRHLVRRRTLQDATVVPADRADDPEVRRQLTYADHELRSRYPDAADIMPTAFGNALRAAESRPGRRYGLDAVTAWPRLYAIMPDRTARIVDTHRDQLELAANLCVALTVAAVSAAGLLVGHPPWLLLPIGLFIMARLAYSMAYAAAIAYGGTVELAFDLHRFDLLRALHVPLPHTPTLERETNAALTGWLLQDLPPNLCFDHPEPPPAVAPAPGQAAPSPQPDGGGGDA